MIVQAFVLLTLCLAAFGARAQEPITLRLKWIHQAQFAGFYVAKETGHYKALGLDVSIQPGGPDFPAIQMIAGGSEQFGVTSADQILTARGKGVPVVALAVIYRKNPFVLFSLRSSGIDRPTKFRGKSVGVKIGGNEELIYRAVLKNAGVSTADLNEVPVKYDLSLLFTGKVAVWPGYLINEVLTAQEKGFDLDIISPADYGVSLYADCLFTTEKTLKNRPDMVKNFVAASLAGWNEAMADPETAARFTMRYGKDLELKHELAMIRASAGLVRPDDHPIGWMDEAGWDAIQRLLLNGGFLKAALQTRQAYTNAYLVP